MGTPVRAFQCSVHFMTGWMSTIQLPAQRMRVRSAPLKRTSPSARSTWLAQIVWGMHHNGSTLHSLGYQQVFTLEQTVIMCRFG